MLTRLLLTLLLHILGMEEWAQHQRPARTFGQPVGMEAQVEKDV